MKTKKILALGLLSVLAITGCNNQSKQDDKKDDEQQDETPKSIESISLNKTTLSLEEEGSETLIATITPSNAANKSLTWSSSDEEVAMVNGLGKVRALKKGTATITVASTENPNIKATCAVTVTEKDRSVHVTSIALNKATLSLDVGEKDLLSVEFTPANTTNKGLVWSTSDATIATVSNGLVTAVKKGKTTITVTSEDKSDVKATCEVTVIDNTIPVNSVRISCADTTNFNSETKTLTLVDVDRPLGQLTVSVKGLDDNNQEVDPTNNKVVWSVTEGTDVVTVSATGQVTALKAGTAKVRATSDDDPTKYDEVNIVVEQESEKDTSVHVTSIAWDGALPETIRIGETVYLSVKITPDNASNTKINFTLGQGESAYVEKADFSNTVVKLTGLAEGQITLTATSADTENNVAPIVANINIVDPIKHIQSVDWDEAINKNGFVQYVGDELDLSNYVKVNPNDATVDSTTYVSDNEEVAIISGKKLIVRKAGEANVTVTVKNDNETKSATFKLVSKNIPVSKLLLNEEAVEIGVNDSFTLVPTVLFNKPDAQESAAKEGSAAVTYVSSNPSVATVNENGVIVAKSTGDATITATAAKANSDDVAKTAECAVTVVAEKPTITILTSPSSILRYEARTYEDNLTDTEDLYLNKNADKGSFFKDTEENLLYKVGDQGKFTFAPTVKARYKGGEDFLYDGATLNRVLKKYNNTSKQYDVIDNLATYASFNGNDIQFTSDAVGERFELTYTIEPKSSYKLADDFELKFELGVVKGYNAYSLADLSLYDNHIEAGVVVDDGVSINWSTYRTEHGVIATSAEGGIVLHDNINLLNDDLIELAGHDVNAGNEIIWTEDQVNSHLGLKDSENYDDFDAWWALLGFKDEDVAKQALYNSPRDYLNIFTRVTHPSDAPFNLQGNFFDLDFSKVKPITFLDPRGEGHYQGELVNGQNGDGSHAQIFGINDFDNARSLNVDPDHRARLEMNNLFIEGNGGISNATTRNQIMLAKGGFMVLKNGYSDYHVNNVINKDTFIGFLSEINDIASNPALTSLEINKVKSYGTFNSALYFHGTKNNVVRDSWFTNAGGPLVLMDEYNAGSWDSPAVASFRPVECDCYNTYLNNPVTGAEPWFETNNALTLVQSYLVGAGAVTWDLADPTNPTLDMANSGWIGMVAANATANAAAMAQLYPSFNGARTITAVDSQSKKVVNFIAIAVNASKFATNYFQPLASKFEVHNGTENGAMNLADVEKDGEHKTPLVDTESLIIAKSSAGGVCYIDADKNPGGVSDYVNVAKFTSGNYMAYYLDPMRAEGPAYNFGYFVGVFLGTYAFTDYWLPNMQ